MESINNASTQLRDLFRSMTPGARVTAGLLLAAVIVSLAYLFAGGGAGPDEYLFGGVPLSPGEANQIQGALLAAGIDVDISGNRIRVPASRKYEAMGAIVSADALPLNVQGFMLDTLNSGSVWEGSKMSKERKEAALEQMLAMTFRTMDWVETATVNYEEKKRRSLGEDIVTAAVAIKPQAGEAVTPSRREAIARLTAANFPGLEPSDVEVLDLHHAGGGGGDDKLDRIAQTTNPYLKDKLVLEDAIRRDIEFHLRDIEGIRVLVQAELNPQLQSVTISQKPDPKGTPRRVETEKESTTSTSPAPGGLVGVWAQAPNPPLPDRPAATNQNQSSVERDAQDNIVGVTQETIHTAGLTPKDIKASIQIPIDWLVQTIWKERWRRQNPDADPADMPLPTTDELQRLQDEQKTQFQTVIENILPDRPVGEDPFPRVQVSFYESPHVEPLPEARFSDAALGWASEHWSTAAMLALAFVSLLVLRSTVKSIGAKGPSAAAERPAVQLELPSVTSRDDDEVEEVERPRLKLNKGPTLKDDLAQLVREDPDVAATILRSWISRAA